MHTHPAKKRKKEQHPKFTFNIPFVSDRFNNQIKHLLAKHNIPARLVNKRGPTLLDITPKKKKKKKKRKEKKNTKWRTTDIFRSKIWQARGICQRWFVVYGAQSAATATLEWRRENCTTEPENTWMQPNNDHTHPRSATTIVKTTHSFKTQKYNSASCATTTTPSACT